MRYTSVYDCDRKLRMYVLTPLTSKLLKIFSWRQVSPLLDLVHLRGRPPMC
jgi:hypothetical protein